MSILDIIVLVILGLFVLIGLWRGFLRTLLSLFGNLASLTVAILLAQPVSKFVNNIINISDMLASRIVGVITNILPVIEEGQELTRDEIINGLTGSKLLNSLITPFIKEGTYTSTSSLANSIGESLGALAMIALTAIVLFFLIKLVIFILAKIFDAITKAHAINGLDRVLGGICGLIKGCILVFSALSVLYALSSLPFISSWFDGLINESNISLQIYNHIQDFFSWLVQKIDIPALISGWLGNT